MIDFTIRKKDIAFDKGDMWEKRRREKTN